MALELLLYCLVSTAGCLQLSCFVSYSFGNWFRPWDPGYLVLAFPLGAILFALLQQRVRLHVDRIWVNCLLLRATLAWTMMAYGLGKLLNQQFSPPSFLAQDTRIFEASGFWKAWAFFGHSDSYEIFLGFGEVLGAVLLGCSRTVNLGAALLVAMLLNICWINWTHDIGVRLASSLYFIQSLLLLKPESQRWTRFLWGLACPAREISPLELRYSKQVSRLGLVYLFCMLAYLGWTQKRLRDFSLQPVPEFTGCWVVEGSSPIQRLRFENERFGSMASSSHDAVEFDCEYSKGSGEIRWKVRDRRFEQFNFNGTLRLLDRNCLELTTADSGQAIRYRRVLPRP